MSKAVAVIDMPNNCHECPLFSNFHPIARSGVNREIITDPFPQYYTQDWCPLKELPEIKQINPDPYYVERNAMYIAGWNDCVREITRKKE